LEEGGEEKIAHIKNDKITDALLAPRNIFIFKNQKKVGQRNRSRCFPIIVVI